MKVTQEKLPNSQMGLEIEIPAEMSKQAYERAISEFTRTANIPGFRKGKVPRQILIQRFGSTNLKAAAVEDLIKTKFEEAVKQEKIEALGNYQLRSQFEELVRQFEPGKPFTFSASVDVPPETNVKQYTDLTLRAEEVKYDPSQVDRFLEEQRNKQATLIPVEDRPAQMGDVTVVDFAGRLVASDTSAETPSETEIPSGKANDFQLELAEGGFIPGFIEGIVGMQLGETKDVSLQFPEDYPQEDLSGKPAVFSITLKEIKEKELPELDDEFAQEVSDFETITELRADLEASYKENAERQTKANKEKAILQALVERVEVEIPQTTIDQEIDSILTQTAMQLANQGVDVNKLFTPETIPQMRERSRPDAINSIKRSLVIEEIAKRESITVEPEAIAAKVEEVLEKYSERDDIDRERLQEFVKSDLLKENTIGWLEERCHLELVPEGSLESAREAGDDNLEATGEIPEPSADEENPVEGS